VSNEATTISMDVLRAHVRELELKHTDITFNWGGYKGRHYGVANQYTGTISLPFEGLRSADDYATVMHELGHLLGPWQTSRGKRHGGAPHGRMVEECGAWLWAKENAVAWTPAMERSMNRALQVNASEAAEKSWAGNKRVVPGARHVFWELAGKPRKAYHFNERNVRRPEPADKAPKPKPTKEELQRARVKKLLKQREGHEAGIRKAHAAIKRKETALKGIDAKLKRYGRQGHDVGELRPAANRKRGRS
jgi:hypothetical protein